MRVNKIKSLISLFLLINLLFSGFLVPTNDAKADSNKKIIITFATTPTTASATKTQLKYNKNFALSYDFDDGLVAGFDPAFTYMNGGYSTYLGQYFGGLYFTDGAGNNVPFRGGYAFYSRNSSYTDLHINTPSYIKWTDLQTAVDNGWDVFNHGYTSATVSPGDNYVYYVGDPGGHAQGNLDYAYELNQLNVDVGAHINLKSNSGSIIKPFQTSQVVLPNGDSNYIQPAFDNSFKAEYSQSSDFTFDGGTVSVPSDTDVSNNISSNRFVMYRQFDYETEFLPGGNLPGGLFNNVDYLASSSTGSDKYWGKEFTHQITTSTFSGDWNGGMTWSSWKSLMDHIENSYGRYGNDTAWVAGGEEVYDYMMVKQNTNLIQTLNGNQLTIELDTSNVPTDLRHYALSLLINSDAQISSISYGSDFTYHTDNKNTGLINIDWGVNTYSSNDITRVESLVTNAESLRTLSSINIARTYTNLLGDQTKKNTYNARLDAIVVTLRTWYVNVRGDLTDAAGVNNCLSTSVSYSPYSPYNWNYFCVGKNAILGNNLTNMKDSDGISSTVSLSNTAPFKYGSLSSAPTGNNSGLYPDDVIDTAAQIYSGSSSPAKVKIYGLDSFKNYNIRLFGYTSNTGNTGDKTITQYTIGGVVKELTVMSNTSQSVYFTNIVPNSSGEIEITINPKNTAWGYGLLNAMAITENLLPAPTALSYNSPNVYTKNTAITPLSPTVTGQELSYSISPSLPAGLTLDSSTGIISGTPTTATGLATYTVTATNSGGSTTFGVVLTVNNIFSLSYLTDSNGTITGSSTQAVISGSNGTPVTAVANSGYYFVKWSDNVTTASRTETNVTDNISVSAQFAANPINNNSGGVGGGGGSYVNNPIIYLPVATGSGTTNSTISINSINNIGNITAGGNNVLCYINSQANFKAPESSSNWQLNNHSLLISNLDLSSDIVTITISSKPQIISLKKGESQEIDLDGDKRSDIIITFADVYVNRAEITIKSLAPTAISKTSAKLNSFIFKKDLKLGQINNDVKELQKYLNANGFLIAKSGPGSLGKETTKFGSATKLALIKFQKARKINPVTGIFGPATRKIVNKIK